MPKPYSKLDSTRHSEREKKEPKRKKPIAKKSKKLIDAEKTYTKERKDYLQAYPYCEVLGCHSESQDIHHRKGRIGALLSDPNFFMAVCRGCHSKIELEPIWAKMKGYSLDRL
jgi:hypothetical protein